MTLPTAGPTGAIDRLDTGAGCNNRCSGCPRPADAADPASFNALDEGAGAGPPEALLVHGGEPTLHPAFGRVLEAAKAAGRSVRVETNARAFAVEGRALQAKKAGLSAAMVTLHGAREASHDFLTRVPGSFRQTVAGAARLQKAGVRLGVRLMVTRSSVQELSQMVTVALGMGALDLRFSWSRMDVPPTGPLPFVRARTWVQGKPDPGHAVFATPAGDKENYDLAREWLVPRYTLAAEYLTAAAALLVRVKRAATVDGVPLCLAPPSLRVVATGMSCATPTARLDAYADPCDGCTLRPRCPGVPSGYLARFGHRELSPPASTAAPPAA